MNRTVFDENKLVYIPVILPGMHTIANKNDYADKVMYWNKDRGIWNYKNLLVSTYHSQDYDLKRDIDVDDDVFILGDSGGFQVVTLGGDISPKEVIEWQKKNCSAGLILDRPPYHFGGGAQFSGTPTKEFFQECLNITKNNAKIALENKENLKLYGVIQGETYEQMCQWYEQMHNLEQNIEFDAWALSPKPSDNPIKVALFGILIQEYKIKKPLHFLQISSKSGILTCALIRQIVGQTVTIDSSSYRGASMYGNVINPISFSNEYITENNLYEDMDGWFCDCPICSKAKINIKNISNSDMHILNIHNLYQIVRYVKYCDFISQFDDMIKKQSKIISEKCKTAIEMLLFYRDNGLHKTKLKFSDYFEIYETGNQKSLFSY